MAIHTLDIRYIGNTKERKGGYRTSYGNVDGEWKAIFSEDVLRKWFRLPANPTQAGSLYSVLGVDEDVKNGEIKSQYRRMARQWHPDVNKELGATEQFQAIQRAYEILSTPGMRAKYDAGLALEKKAGWSKELQPGEMPTFLFRPPLRCGLLLVEAHPTRKGDKLIVDEILLWDDIYDGWGNVLVTSWTYGDDTYTVMWVPTGGVI
jgi:hypothetical protein